MLNRKLGVLSALKQKTSKTPSKLPNYYSVEGLGVSVSLYHYLIGSFISFFIKISPKLTHSLFLSLRAINNVCQSIKPTG
jgi:hypothetical protein